MPLKTIQTLDGFEIDCDRIASFRTVALSPYEGPVIIKMMVLTGFLGEAIEKILKMVFKTLDEAYNFMNSVVNPLKEIDDGGPSQLYVVRR